MIQDHQFSFTFKNDQIVIILPMLWEHWEIKLLTHFLVDGILIRKFKARKGRKKKTEDSYTSDKHCASSLWFWELLSFVGHKKLVAFV